MNAATRFLAASATALVAAAFFSARADAMPPFAQAYGVKCSVCHTAVPALNAYGRYVQRTGYASLDPHVLRRALPVWFGENVSYDSESGPPPKIQFGNMAIHAVGYIGDDVTYHFQQWILSNDQAGDLDTFWMTYNNLLHRDGHLFVGLIEAPGPSPYSQWMDLAAFSTPEITVGEHAYELDGNGWGSKANYIHGSLDLEAGWLYGTSGWSQSNAFTNSDKRWVYKAAWANPEQPLEVGVQGSRGSWPLAEGGFDQYWSVAPYAQRDPKNGVPGVLAIYQMALDGNPLATNQSAGSNATTLELYEPFLDDTGIFSVRKEWTNDGLGTRNQTGNIDVSYQVARFLHLYAEEYFGSHTTPGFAWTLWWTTPLSSVK